MAFSRTPLIALVQRFFLTFALAVFCAGILVFTLSQPAHSEEMLQDSSQAEETDERMSGADAGANSDTSTDGEDDLWQEADDFAGKRFDFYGALMGGYSLDDESGLNKAEGEWAMSFSFGEITGRLRIGDFVSFPNQRNPVRIEKYQVNVPTGKFEITAGTFPLTFGKGLILNSFEERNLNYENEIEGVLAKHNGGRLQVKTFAGIQKLRGDASSTRLFGARADLAVGKNWKVGGSWLSEDESNSNALVKKSRKKTVGYEIDTELSWEHFSFYLEYLRLDNPLGFTDGNGLYATATLKYPGFGLTLEKKDYDSIAHRVGVPPPTKYTPEHAYSDPNNEKGYAVSMFYAPFENTSYFEVIYDQSNLHGGGFLQTETIISYYSPRDRDFSYALIRSRYKDPSIEDKFWRLETQYAFPNGNGISLNVELTDYSLGTVKRKEQKVELGLTFGTWLNVAFTQEKLPRRTFPERQWWNLIELRLQRPAEDVLTVTYGKRRAGFVCSGGVCRLEPEFDGWKVFYTRYF